MPEEDTIKLQELREIQISWKNQVDKISNDSNMAKIVTAGAGAAGIATGVAVVTLAPTVAMGVATTFGVASTGTAISALSGAAGIINIRLSKIVTILLALYIIIHAVKYTKIIDAITKIGEII